MYNFNFFQDKVSMCVDLNSEILILYVAGCCNAPDKSHKQTNKNPTTRHGKLPLTLLAN